MNNRSDYLYAFILLVTLVANPLTAMSDPLSVPSSPTGPGVIVPPPATSESLESYPAAIQILLDRGSRLVGRGVVGDLPFWMMETPSGPQTYITSPQGFVVRGQVYDPGGLLKLDTAATPPVILDPVRQRREGIRLLFGETSSTIPSETTAEDWPSTLNNPLAGAETLVRGATGPEGVWADLGQATVIEEGDPRAPLVYAFIDPYCAYCHQQWRLLRQPVAAGVLRVRWAPVVVLEASKRQLPKVLGLLHSMDAEGLARWMTQRIVESRTDVQAKLALVRNQALFSRLQANKVPALLYRAAEGQVILRTGLSPLSPATTTR